MRVCTRFFAFLEEVFHSLYGFLNEIIGLWIVWIVVTWMKPYVLDSSWNNAEVNWVSLPVTSLSGIPCSSNMDFRCAIVVSDRMLFNFHMNRNLL